MAQPDHSAVERLATDPPERLPGAGAYTVDAVTVDHTWRSGQAVDGRLDRVLNSTIKGGRRNAPLILPPPPRRSLWALITAPGQVIHLRTEENSGTAILAEFGEVGIQDPFAQHRDSVIAADVVLTIVDKLEEIDGDGPSAPSEHIRHSLPADIPAIGPEAVRHLLVMLAQRVGRPFRRGRSEPAGMKAAVDGGEHVAEDERTQRRLSRRLDSEGTPE